MSTRSIFEPSLQITAEEQWIRDNLDSFHFDNIITDVLYPVKGGKEANVYCCRAHPSTGVELLAAKIYRPQSHRTMRNDWLYRQGRETIDSAGKAIRDGRSLRAIQKRTRHGKDLLRASWIVHEYGTLQALYEAGVAVPRPLDIRGSTILMEYVGDASAAAPVLHGLHLERAEAEDLLRCLLGDIERMLSVGIIHGDLSAHNVLYWRGELKIIDVPQAVQADGHPQALTLLSRDVERVCQYFARQGAAANATQIACDLWERFVHGQFRV